MIRRTLTRWWLALAFAVWASGSRWSLLILDATGASGDITYAYGSAGTFTISLASLATSSTWVAGRESTAITVAAPATDYMVSAKITVGTTPTSGTYIQIWAYAVALDGTTWPDAITGSDANYTFTSAGIRNAGFVLLKTLEVDSTTSNRAYWMHAVSIRGAFGGALPEKFGIVVTHNTAVNLNSTGGNHVIAYRPVYEKFTP